MPHYNDQARRRRDDGAPALTSRSMLFMHVSTSAAVAAALKMLACKAPDKATTSHQCFSQVAYLFPDGVLALGC